MQAQRAPSGFGSSPATADFAFPSDSVAGAFFVSARLRRVDQLFLSGLIGVVFWASSYRKRLGVLNLSFSAEVAHMQLSSNFGMTLSLDLKLKPESPAFLLASGVKLHECIFNLTIHPVSGSPYAEKLKDDGRLGEFRPFMTRPTKGKNLYMLWVHVGDGQWNVLYAEAAKGNLPIDIDIGFDDDDDTKDGLKEGAYDDMSIGNNLAVRFFLFTLKLAGAKGKTAE